MIQNSVLLVFLLCGFIYRYEYVHFLGSLSTGKNIIIKSSFHVSSFLVTQGVHPRKYDFHYPNVGFQRTLPVVKLEITNLTTNITNKY